ncbi:hypothetical protein BC938DRAFT_477186 [Jimgerdemannia flammicorona]|uniref:Uncharacterized protein n=1 Tax=Jimgerdemannia flammicorona TaxID=994334 RepID=A0A433QPM8_9FUNG|nr:hypothetical protein BC938DRAFT_477186 [Jimgerdemannia flammicorona]
MGVSLWVNSSMTKDGELYYPIYNGVPCIYVGPSGPSGPPRNRQADLAKRPPRDHHPLNSDNKQPGTISRPDTTTKGAPSHQSQLLGLEQGPLRPTSTPLPSNPSLKWNHDEQRDQPTFTSLPRAAESTLGTPLPISDTSATFSGTLQSSRRHRQEVRTRYPTHNVRVSLQQGGQCVGEVHEHPGRR